MSQEFLVILPETGTISAYTTGLCRKASFFAHYFYIDITIGVVHRC